MHTHIQGIAKKIHYWLIVATVILLSACASEHHKSSPMVYVESANPMQDVQNGLNKALSNNKRLLLVMGAQWCHDSRGLASNFATPEMLAITNAHYEVVYVDVGYFKDLRAITERFSQPHYFATPTVMIIDPKTETLLNASDMSIWGSADSLALSEYLAYFSRYSAKNSPADIVQQTINNEQKMTREARNQLQAFSKFQAQRLTRAYAVLVPNMIKEDETQQANQVFFDQWGEVRKFRMALQKDLQALRERARTEPLSQLELPTYPPFSWE